MSWDKVRTMNDLESKVQDGQVDVEILPIINVLNASPNYYTTSSCAGRIQVLELPQIGDKENSRVLGKWHHQITLNDVKTALTQRSGNGQIYLLAQSPIIHVVCNSLHNAAKLRNLADSSGFKYSSIRSLKEKKPKVDVNEFEKITVEILSTERLDVPIALENHVYPHDEYFDYLIENANICLERARMKLKNLLENLKRSQ